MQIFHTSRMSCNTTHRHECVHIDFIASMLWVGSLLAYNPVAAWVNTHAGTEAPNQALQALFENLAPPAFSHSDAFVLEARVGACSCKGCCHRIEAEISQGS